jgi:hypothetical protein
MVSEDDAIKYSVIVAIGVTVLYTLTTSQFSGWNIAVAFCSALVPYVAFRFDELGGLHKIGGMIGLGALLFMLANPLSFMLAPYSVAAKGDISMEMRLDSAKLEYYKSTYSTDTTTLGLTGLGPTSWFDPDGEHKRTPDIRFRIVGAGSENLGAFTSADGKWTGNHYKLKAKVYVETQGSVTWGDTTDETGWNYAGDSKLIVKVELDNHKSSRKTMLLSDSKVSANDVSGIDLKDGSFTGVKKDSADERNLDFKAECKIKQAGVPTSQDKKATITNQGPNPSDIISAYWMVEVVCASVKEVSEPSEPSEPSDPDYTPPPDDDNGYEPPPVDYEPPAETPTTPQGDNTWLYAIAGVFILLIVGGGILLLLVLGVVLFYLLFIRKKD